MNDDMRELRSKLLAMTSGVGQKTHYRLLETARRRRAPCREEALAAELAEPELYIQSKAP
jgi:hypothetical protein